MLSVKQTVKGENNMNKLINVLSAIEKDLRIIASKYVGCDDPGPKGSL